MPWSGSWTHIAARVMLLAQSGAASVATSLVTMWTFAGKTAIKSAMIPHADCWRVRRIKTPILRMISAMPERYTSATGRGNYGGTTRA